MSAVGWRRAFFLAALPGVLMALLIETAPAVLMRRKRDAH